MSRPGTPTIETTRGRGPSGPPREGQERER
jgi:hypothetical protein